MIVYTFNKSVNPSRLATEVPQTNFSHVETEGQTVKIFYTVEVDQAAVQAAVTSHQAVVAADTVAAAIVAAAEFGRGLILEYATSNVLTGFTVEQIKDIMTRTAAVRAALETGSLYVAIDELRAIEPDATIITESKLLAFINRIEAYLGLPPSTSL